MKSIFEILKVQNLPFQHILEALSFDFYESLQFLKSEIYKIDKIQSPKIEKKTVLDSPLLISRKI